MNAPGRGLDKQAVKDALASMGGESLCGALGLLSGERGSDKENARDWYATPQGFMVRCPLHGGVSCHVFGDDGAWKCHGCDRNGDALALVAAVEGLDSREDFRRLLDAAASLAGVSPDATPRSNRTTRQAPARPVKARRDATDVETFSAVAEVLLSDPSTSLLRGREAPNAAPLCGECDRSDCVRCYLNRRCILASAIDDGWGALPAREDAQRALVSRIVARTSLDAWERSGLARKSDPSRFVWSRNMLVIPWRDRSGRVTALQRRLIDAPRDTEPRYAQSGTIRDPYGAHRLRDDGAPVVFVEGAVDALSLSALLNGAHPSRVVLGLPGHAWRDEWAAHARGRDALIALDIDAKESAAEGTQRAREAMARALKSAARSVHARGPELDGHTVKDWSDVWERQRW